MASKKIVVPPSKSHTMRALLLASMAEGRSQIHHPLYSADTEKMIIAMRALGAEIEMNTSLHIKGVAGILKPSFLPIDAGNSGQIFRFVGALAALMENTTEIVGDSSILHRRPIQPLIEALRQLGASAEMTQSLSIRGAMKAGRAVMAGEDSQPVSALLMAASFLDGVTELEVLHPGEKPWIDLTLFWLKRVGAKVSHHDYRRYKIEGPLSYQGFETTIPGDFSSAAFPVALALIKKRELRLDNLDMEDVQGDKKFLEIVQQMGAKIEQEERGIVVRENGSLQGITIDVNEIIDAIPILAVLGCFAEGKTELVNGAIARKKESDRLSSITQELRKMGAKIEEREGGLVIWHSKLQGADLDSHEDHRIAMALFVAAEGAYGKSRLQRVECVKKSYPAFFEELCQI